MHPRQRVEDKTLGANLIDRKLPPAAVRRVRHRAWRPTIRILAKALEKSFEVSRGQRSALLGYRWHVRAGVVNPSLGRWRSLPEEDHVRLRALGVWRERSARATQKGVNFAVLHQHREHLGCLCRE